MTFEEFAQTRLPALLAFAIVLTGQGATAEDITQEVLIRAHGQTGQISSLGRPDLYVRKMVLNEFLSWRRRCWRTVPAANPVPRPKPWQPGAWACTSRPPGTGAPAPVPP
jgi:DNA-directed RNA polymerase specialized sigma24 family protein